MPKTNENWKELEDQAKENSLNAIGIVAGVEQHTTAAIARSRGRICCVGMCVLDIIHVCSNYPIEDTDKRCLTGHMQRGGNASNMCTVLRELDYDQVEFLGIMSTASGFEFLRSDCQRRNIKYDNCPTVTQNPPFSSVILVENTDSRTIIHSNSNFPIFQYDEHFKKIQLNFNDYSWFHFEARNPKEISQMQNLIHAYNVDKEKQTVELEAKLEANNNNNKQPQQQQQRQRIIVSVEFEKLFEENFILALAADYVFLGKELACHMGWHDAEKAVYGLRKWIEMTRSTNKQPNQIETWQKHIKTTIICPWGALGAGVLNELDEYSFLKAKTPKKIIDALGAGDTFCAATIFALAALKLNIEKAVDFGNTVAGLKLAQYGYDGLKIKLEEYLSKG